VTFNELGRLCRSIDGAYQRDDYRQTFPFIDNIRPVADPELLEKLERHIIDAFRAGQLDAFGLAPPEMIDWVRIDGFRFYYERRTRLQRPCNPFLYLPSLVAWMRHEDILEGLDAQFLKTHYAKAVDGDGHDVHEWPLWRCLFGEVIVDGTTYILDEGDFYQVDNDYLATVNNYLDALPESSIELPAADPDLKEPDYNALIIRTLGDRALLLDTRTVRLQSRTTPVEICDVLTDSRVLIHVKRGLGSRHLSHLFAQGFVSAELLWGDEDFRMLAHRKVLEHNDTERFLFFGDDDFMSRDFEVTFAIITNWGQRTVAQALPFFSKINLRKTTEELTKRGYRVSLSRVPTVA